MDPDLVIRAVCNQDVLLLRVIGKGEIVNRSAHAKGCAAGAAAFGAASRRRGVHEEAGNKFALLGKYLHSVVSSLADINESVIRNVDAVKRGRKLLLIGRRSRFPVIRRRRVVVDLAQGYAVAAPAALERAAVHVIHEDALLVHDVELVGVLVQIKEKNPARKSVGVLVILFQRLRLLPRRRSRSAMAKVPEKFPIACKFLDAVSP